MADEKTTIELTLDERQTHTLFGNHDENLRAIEDAFKVKISSRGHEIYVSGAEENRGSVQRLLGDLQQLIGQGYPMQKSDAVGYLNNLSAGCGGMHYIVWGDDGGEQYLFDRNYPGVHDDIDGFIRATDRGLEYLQQFVVPASVLNEDSDGTDEVFVRARFVDGDCGSRVQNTNVVNGDF